MKKTISLIICFVSVTLLLLSCSERSCEHVYSDGVCENCDVACTHTYENGVCSICSTPCEHAYKDGVCSVCSKVCAHNEYEHGTCIDCGYVCEKHFFSKGACTNCGIIKLTKDLLENRCFEYSHLEVTWSKDATDAQKEIMIKQFGVNNEDELFVELYKQIHQAGGIIVNRYAFTSDGVNYSISGKVTQSDKYYINTHNYTIEIGDDKLYYTGDGLYVLQEAGTTYTGISIKLIYTEK